MVVISACADKRLSPGEGFIDVEGGRVWYKIVGTGNEVPLLLLHGGPGAPSYYLNPLEKVSVDRPVIFYDQLGAGRSDRPTDESLWRMDRFIGELVSVREALGLKEVHILGHSWGSMSIWDPRSRAGGRPPARTPRSIDRPVPTGWPGHRRRRQVHRGSPSRP